MLRRRALSIALSLAMPAMALAPFAFEGEAAGQRSNVAPKAKPAASAQAAGSDRYDPDNIKAISEYMETLVKGTERFEAKDVNGAIDLFKKAIQLSPKNPYGHLLLGEAYLAQENLGEAEAAFKEAVEDSDSKNPALRSKCLFAIADVYEREKKLPEARTAWQAYAEHAPKVPDGGTHPESAVGRMKAIDDMLKLEKSYVAVRERIAAEKADAGKAPPPKK